MTRSEKVLWFCFAATCCQLVFLQPSVVLVPGERANLFAGLLCAVNLATVLLLGKKEGVRLRSPEVVISLILALLAGVSAAYSLTPLSSAFRVFVLLASGLGGFWCARILLATPASQWRFQRLCLALLAGLVLLSLAGYFSGGTITRWVRSDPHPLDNNILLLSFAPLAWLAQPARSQKMAALVLLGLSYATLCLSTRLSVVFIPLGVCVLVALFGPLRLKHLLLILVVMALGIGFFHQSIRWQNLSREHPDYRIESFPFSLSIARQHPLLGIGLRAPREQFLEHYQIWYPYLTKEKFTMLVNAFVTADNVLLTLMTGLGLPFTLLYAAALTLLLARLVSLARRPPPGLTFHPLVLFFPLVAALAHYLLYDGLLFPQNCWFFHILLGLIPAAPGRAAAAVTRPAPGPIRAASSGATPSGPA